MNRKFKQVNPIHAEVLESRILLSSINLVRGMLTIDGTGRDDYVDLSQNGEKILVDFNGQVKEFKVKDVKAVKVNLKNGDDSLVSQVNVPVSVFGGNGRDNLLIVSSLANNLLVGGNGDDLLSTTGAGSDILKGQNGNDTLYFIVGAPNTGLGGNGKDTLISRDGIDVTDARRNDNLISFRFDRPKVDLRDGVLYLMGDASDDKYLVREVGNKLVVTLQDDFGFNQYVFNRNDVKYLAGILFDGDDVLLNNTSVKSVFYGANGNDVLVGGNSDDVLKGGGGDDLIVGNKGRDFLTGDNGRDFLVGNAQDFLLRDNDDVFVDTSFLDNV